MICNVCACELQSRDPTAFLCTACEIFAPPAAMARYHKAVKNMRQWRRMNPDYSIRTPLRFKEEIAVAWRLARDAARARAGWRRAAA